MNYTTVIPLFFFYKYSSCSLVLAGKASCKQQIGYTCFVMTSGGYIYYKPNQKKVL
jgi:hypothetical protein